MDGKDLDQVFAEATETKAIKASEALAMIAKSMSKVANPSTTDDDARDTMIRCYAFTKAAAAAFDGGGEGETLHVDKSLVEAVEADGEGVHAEPVSRACDSIRKRFEPVAKAEPVAAAPEATPAAASVPEATATSPATTPAAESGGKGFDARGVQWQHDLNTEPDPDDDWGRDPK